MIILNNDKKSISYKSGEGFEHCDNGYRIILPEIICSDIIDAGNLQKEVNKFVSESCKKLIK